MTESTVQLPIIDRRSRFALVYHSESSRTPLHVSLHRRDGVVVIPALELSVQGCDALIAAIRAAKDEVLILAQAACQVPQSGPTTNTTLAP